MNSPGEPIDRPDDFKISIQGGMLEALGINMYSTLGKCLVEFVANAYDAEASCVEILIPLEDVEKSRSEVRAAAKKEVEAGTRERFTLLTLPLPDAIEVTIRDDGHGMTPADIENKFLPFNRNRRLDDSTEKEVFSFSENNKRQVMGRKGLGKLAGFGAAEVVTIRTKRAGATFATEFVLDYRELKTKQDMSGATVPATYVDDIPIDEHWTEVTLARLKCDAVKVGKNGLAGTLANNFFGIAPADFAIQLNGDIVESPPVQYEYYYPPVLKPGETIDHKIEIDGFGPVAFKYAVMFRKRGENLPAKKRGARIYCTNRLAAGPTLFDLPTGMHGFHNISYMECVVIADEFDQLGIDLISTNRSELKKDTEVVRALIDEIVDLMQKAVAAHASFRDAKAEKEVSDSETGSVLLKVIDRLPAKSRKPARSLLKMLAADHGVKSEEFREMAPLVIDCMNATDVLIRLIELGSDAETVKEVAEALRELSEIEQNDSLKLYRGRKSGIFALNALINRGEELWNKKGIEDELHNLLKRAPWLIRPEFSRYVASDEALQSTYSKLAKELKVDAFSPKEQSKKDEAKNKRPDLVFIMGPASVASDGTVVVVELKSPSLALEAEHLQQLKHYMARIKDYLHGTLGTKVNVRGILIGRRGSPKSAAEGVYMLREEEAEAGPGTKWEVMDLNQMVESALKVHIDEIEHLESELPDESALKLVSPSKSAAQT